MQTIFWSGKKRDDKGDKKLNTDFKMLGLKYNILKIQQKYDSMWPH